MNHISLSRIATVTETHLGIKTQRVCSSISLLTLGRPRAEWWVRARLKQIARDTKDTFLFHTGRPSLLWGFLMDFSSISSSIWTLCSTVSSVFQVNRFNQICSLCSADSYPSTPNSNNAVANPQLKREDILHWSALGFYVQWSLFVRLQNCSHFGMLSLSGLVVTSFILTYIYLFIIQSCLFLHFRTAELRWFYGILELSFL